MGGTGGKISNPLPTNMSGPSYHTIVPLSFVKLHHEGAMLTSLVLTLNVQITYHDYPLILCVIFCSHPIPVTIAVHSSRPRPT